MQLGGGVLSSLLLTRFEVPIELQANFAGLRHTPLFFAGWIQKLNRKDNVQKRVLLMTLDHVYISHPNGDILRCFPFSAVEVILWDPSRQQIGLVVPSEYDVAFASSDTHAIVHVIETIRGLHNCRVPHRVEMLSSLKDEVDDVSRLQSTVPSAVPSPGLPLGTEQRGGTQREQKLLELDATGGGYDNVPSEKSSRRKEEKMRRHERTRKHSEVGGRFVGPDERHEGDQSGDRGDRYLVDGTSAPPLAAMYFADDVEGQLQTNSQKEKDRRGVVAGEGTSRGGGGGGGDGGRGGSTGGRYAGGSNPGSESEPGDGRTRDDPLLLPARPRPWAVGRSRGDESDTAHQGITTAADTAAHPSYSTHPRRQQQLRGEDRALPPDVFSAPALSPATTTSRGTTETAATGKTSGGPGGATSGSEGNRSKRWFSSLRGGGRGGRGGQPNVGTRKAPPPTRGTLVRKVMVFLGLRSAGTSVVDGVDDWYHGLQPHEHCIGRGFYKLSIEKPPGFKLRLDRINE